MRRNKNQCCPVYESPIRTLQFLVPPNETNGYTACVDKVNASDNIQRSIIFVSLILNMPLFLFDFVVDR